MRPFALRTARLLLGFAALAAVASLWIATQLLSSLTVYPPNGYEMAPINVTDGQRRYASSGGLQPSASLLVDTKNGDLRAQIQREGTTGLNTTTAHVADVQLVRRSIISRYHSDSTVLQTSEQGLEVPPSSYLYFRDENEFKASCMAQPREGKERKAGWRLLTQKIQVNGPDPVPLAGQLPMNPILASGTLHPSDQNFHQEPRILCAIYTYEKRHPSVSAIGETWGWKCDGFFAASTKTIDGSDPNLEGLGAVQLDHKGPEKYENMWQKTRSILLYMHSHFLNDFDFFFLSGDDTFVIVENLRRMISSLGKAATNEPLYLGQWIPDGKAGRYFCGGGPGYLLNRKSLELLATTILPNCHVDTESPAEDRMLGDCFRRFGIVGNHSIDAANAQRFHGMDPHDTCTMKGDTGFFGRVYQFWGEHYGFKTGFNLTSSQSVSFHMLKTPKHLKRIHAILYNSCPPNTTISKALLELN